MDNTARLQYLHAMGIPVWLPRFNAPVVPAVIDDVIDESATQPIKIALSQAEQWQALQTQVQNCTRCDLCQTRKQTVFGAGNRQADWLIIGEAPGQQEDEQGLPFVGVAGQLLTEMLRAVGLQRDTVFIANILKCRPPNNRDPHVDEIKQCEHYWQQQIQLIQPKIILAVGRHAAHTLLNSQETIGKLRGTVHQFNNIPVVVVYHPAYLLRSLSEKRKAWQDLQLAQQTMMDG